MEENTSKVYVGTSGPIGATTAAAGAGSPLFVINLCASIAPIDPSSRNIPGLENYRLYQVARVEDGRTRHRLRLGFFTSESHAESVLAIVRQQYPTAFTTSLCDEDKRFARGYLPDAAAAPKRPMTVVSNSAAAQPKAPAAAAPVTKPATATPAAKSATTAAPGPRPAAAKTLAPAAPEVIELTWEPEPTAKAPAVAANTASAPKPSAPPSDASTSEFTWEAPELHAAAPAASSPPQTSKPPVVRTTASTQPVIKAGSAAAAAPQPPEPKPAAPRTPAKLDTSASVRVPALTLSDPPPPPPAAQVAKPAEPFHVGRGVQIADAGITLHADPPAPAAAVPAAKSPQTAVKPAGKPAAPAQAAPAAKVPAKAPAAAKSPAPARTMPVHVTPPPAVKPPAVRISASAEPVFPKAAVHNPLAELPELDSTQTIRALTSAELEEEQQEKWFCVQLAISEQPVNLETMPRLDIFEAYRLYSVATAGSGKILHSLRLGFFKEAVSAEAVCGYLKTFFSSPTVIRVSMAEHTRFQDRPAKKSAPKREAEVVELSSARAARPVPTVTMEVSPPPVDTGATGSFKLNATGAFKIDASGTHEALPGKIAAKAATPATKRSQPAPRGRSSSSASGKHKALSAKKSLEEQLLEEAREIELSESAIRKLPKNDSLLSRLVGKLTK